MSRTPTLCDSSTDNTEADPRLDVYDPEFSETPTPVNEPVEVKPVSWDVPYDPKNPQNWSPSRKWLVMSVNAIVTVNVYVFRATSAELTS